MFVQPAARLPISYCRDDLEVQRFVEEQTWQISPYSLPETTKSARQIFEAARARFTDWRCFYLRIEVH